MTVVEILKRKLFMAQERYKTDTVMLAGGVSCNNRLKATIREEVEKK
jgi:tRNA A37 threonylcarbamoyltransferase TsaD